MTVPATMRALQQASLLGPQDLRLITDAPVPSPGPGEVLIRVTAAYVNFVDVSQARGTFAGGPQPPYLAGIEAAGEVAAVGEGSPARRPARTSSASASRAAPSPSTWCCRRRLRCRCRRAGRTSRRWPGRELADGAGGAQTARRCRGEADRTDPRRGRGTGQAAVKMAKHYGATVIAAAAPAKHEAVRALGADHVIDSRGADIAAEVLHLTGGTGADLVLSQAAPRSARVWPRPNGSPAGSSSTDGRRRGRDHQLGAGLRAPGPRHRPERRRPDPGRTAGLRRGHG